MAAATVIDDLYRYNDWANGRLFRLCDGLADLQLDEPRSMGFGSLRATLFHMLAAEQIWLERWTDQPWRSFPTDPAGMSLSEIAGALQRVAEKRRQCMDADRSTGWKRLVDYRDSKGTPYSQPLDDLLLHVANHGIHHRAQALNYLKRFGRTVPGGLDYVFYRLALPTVLQEDATMESLRSYGLEVNTAPGAEVAWEGNCLQRYFDYHDWADGKVVELASSLDATALDRPFDIGPGSIRKTLLHLHDAEAWWVRNWTIEPRPYEYSPTDTPIDQLHSSWSNFVRQRNAFIAKLDSAGAQRVLAVLAGGPPVKITVLESLVQLCGHGTHHRAQLVNMLRQTGVPPPALDIVIWIRGLESAAEKDA